MKFTKFYLFILLAFGCVLSSCKDNDEDLSNIENVIVGNWDSEFLGEAYKYDLDALDVNDKTLREHYEYLTFYSNQTGYSIYYSGNRTDWKWEIIDGTLYTQSEKGYPEYYDIINYSKDVIYLLRRSHYDAIIKMVRREK